MWILCSGSTKFWLNFNIFFTAPALAIVTYFVVPKEAEHIKHIEEHPYEWQAFPYLRKRKNVC
jgi:hypothetical protein